MFDIEPARLRGLKLGTIGFLIGASGVGIAFLGATQIGVLIGWIGGLTVFAGMIWHFVLMFQHFTNRTKRVRHD